MDISPTPEFRETCRRILGDDSPATIITAIRTGDPRMRVVRDIHADIMHAKFKKERGYNDQASNTPRDL